MEQTVDDARGRAPDAVLADVIRIDPSHRSVGASKLVTFDALREQRRERHRYRPRDLERIAHDLRLFAYESGDRRDDVVRDERVDVVEQTEYADARGRDAELFVRFAQRRVDDIAVFFFDRSAGKADLAFVIDDLVRALEAQQFEACRRGDDRHEDGGASRSWRV